MRPTAEEDVAFVKNELLPEMVHDRCFCDPGSREFVEFDSAEVSLQPREAHHLDFGFYRARVVVLFSGEAQVFRVLVKLLPEDCMSEPSLMLAFDGFLNEEILWNKARLQLGGEFLPKFYAANMGKYGRPVVVVEDLERNGYERVIERGLEKEEAEKVLELIGALHGKGLAMKEERFPVYREFQAKFQEITFAETAEKEMRDKFDRYVKELQSKSEEKADQLKNLAKLLGDEPYLHFKKSSDRDPSTICNSYLLRENLWFKRSREASDGNKIEQVKILDWQRVRCGSNCLDLAIVLSECETVDHGNELLDAYVKAVQKENPSATKAELAKGLIEPGFGYELVVAAIENRPVDRVPSILRLA